MYVIGVNFSHDYSACLLKDSEIRVALGLERLVRIRRGLVRNHLLSRSLHELVRYCLDAEGIGIDAVDYFIGCSTETRSEAEERALLDGMFFLPPEKVLAMPHPGHHLAHASASFHTSGFEEAAALVVDAYGSIVGERRESETGFVLSRREAPRTVFRNLKPSVRIAGLPRGERLLMPDQFSGIGEIYHVVTLALGFRQTGTYYDDAGKTMGLAPFGRPLSAEPVFIRITEHGLDYSNALPFMASLNLVSTEGGEHYLNVRPSHVPLSQFHRDLAAQVQWELEEACLYLARRLRRETGLRQLVLGGGTFLNSVTNTRILREAGFDDVYIFPAATDDGTAVGAAFHAESTVRGHRSNGRAVRHETAAFGRRYPDERIRRAIDRRPVTARDAGDVLEAARRAAAALAEGRIIGWYQGGAEFGPRALGNRSILANPMLPNIKDTLNDTVKFRESFRPFAPAVIEERAEEYFELDGCASPFMLRICGVRAAARDLLPGITHVDGTARVQTVSKHGDPVFYELIREFGRLTGCPVVLNTSFNLRGMPIVETPEEALHCFLSTEMDLLCAGRFVVPAPDFASFVPVRRSLTVAATGIWPSESPGWHTGQLSIRNGSGSHSADAVLTHAQIEMLETIDGHRNVREIASRRGVTILSATRAIQSLYRDHLVEWRELTAVGDGTATAAVADVRTMPYDVATI